MAENDMEFPGVSKKYSMWNFQGLIKNKVEFRGVLVFGLGISKGCNITLQ